MRTTLTLDQDIYEAALHQSRLSGESLGKVVSDLARKGLKPDPIPRKKKGQRFPTFKVPPGAPTITAAHIQKILDDEGIF